MLKKYFCFNKIKICIQKNLMTYFLNLFCTTKNVYRFKASTLSEILSKMNFPKNRSKGLVFSFGATNDYIFKINNVTDSFIVLVLFQKKKIFLQLGHFQKSYGCQIFLINNF